MAQALPSSLGRQAARHTPARPDARPATTWWLSPHGDAAGSLPHRRCSCRAVKLEPFAVDERSNGAAVLQLAEASAGAGAVAVGAAACGPSGSAGEGSWSSRLAFERLYQLSPVLGSSDAGVISTSLWSRGLFLVSVDDKPAKTSGGAPPPPNKAPGEKSPDYYANVGDAIRTLREDIPHLFERDLNYDIYRDDITFRDPRNSFSGMKNYRLIFWSLRFHGRIFFKQLYVEVRRIWQPSDGVISMRWTVHGVPRVPWEAEGTFDGISQYKLDSDGRIYEHAVDNVILRDPPVQGVPLLAGLNLVPGAPQQPCPGAWFRGLEEGAAAAAASAASAVDSSNSWLAAIVHFSWVHLYAALLGTMQLQAADTGLVPATAAAAASAAAATAGGSRPAALSAAAARAAARVAGASL